MVNDAILQNIQTDNTWVDVETVAFLKNISKRGVRLSLKSNKYVFKKEKTRGGTAYKIKLSSLEEVYQIKYIEEYCTNIQAVENEIIELSNVEIKQDKLLPENQRKMALAKYDGRTF